MPEVAPLQAVTELKVTGNLMVLGTGIFCVFHTPGAPPADVQTGLPGVRISPAPAANGYVGRVQITGFDEGWLGGPEDAVLIRVSGGPAQILVTIYQAQDSHRDPPKLQVIRLDDQTAEAKPAPTPAVTGPAATPEVAAHIYGVGDVAGVLSQWVGERGSKRWIEGFGLSPNADVAASDIEYQAVLGRGWLSPWSEGGQFCGSRGMSLPILGLRVRLRGAAAEKFATSLSATFIDGTEVGPVGDGAPCEAPSLAALEAFRVEIRPVAKKGRKPPAQNKPPAQTKAPVVAKTATKPKAAVKPKAGANPVSTPKTTTVANPTPKAGVKRTPATSRRR